MRPLNAKGKKKKGKLLNIRYSANRERAPWPRETSGVPKSEKHNSRRFLLPLGQRGSEDRVGMWSMQEGGLRGNRGFKSFALNTNS